MNIENKKQAAIIFLAVGLGLVASMVMSMVVEKSIKEQTKQIVTEYQMSSTKLVQEIDKNKKELSKLYKDHEALKQKVAQQPAVREVVVQPTLDKPQVQKIAFSMRTPPGKRALTMEIDTLSAVGGLINPGDFVDIIAKLEKPEEEKEKVAAKGQARYVQVEDKEKIISVLFQNVQVLAVGTNYDPTGVVPPYEVQRVQNKLNITFAVNPEEAGLLTFAQENGTLQLSLRSSAETQGRVVQQVASWDSLSEFVLDRQGTQLYEREPEVEPVEVGDFEEPSSFIQIFRGGREL